MAGRKLTKYEKMWRTRRHNAKLKKKAMYDAINPLTGGPLLRMPRKNMPDGTVRTSNKRLKPHVNLTQAYAETGEAIKQALYGDRAISQVPEIFVIVKDSLGRGIMVNVRDVLQAAEVIKQTGCVE